MESSSKTIIKNIAVLLFAVIMSITCIACDCTGEAEKPQGPITTDTDVISAAKSEYSIIIADNADANEITAARELQTFFKEATGFELSIKSDSGATAGGKYFSIGATDIVTDAVKESLNEVTQSQGYIIKTIEDTVYLLGKSSFGTLYSVYGYLNRTFNYEYYFTDVYSIDKNVTDFKFVQYDEAVNPDINGMSVPSSGFIIYNSVNRQRFNVMSTQDWCIPANGYTKIHNLFKIMPIEGENECISSHPKWFSENHATGCFTAHGDSAEFEAMQTYFFNVIVKGIKQSSANIFTISQPDNAGFCNCLACSDASARFGGKSGILVDFCNKLADRVTEWFKTAEGKPYERDFKLLFLAYQEIKEAPADISCNDNVGVYLAFDGFRSSYGLDEDANNKALAENVREWMTKTHNFVFWIYDVNFTNYFYPYDTSAYKQDFYRLMKEAGALIVNDQSQTQNQESTVAWNNVKSYVSTKLRWNVNANVAELTKNFFDNCYKNASATMYKVYSEYKAHWAALKQGVSNGTINIRADELGSIFGHLNNKDLWSRTMLESWVKDFNNALTEIEPLKQTDLTAYKNAYKMISAEIVSPLYILIDLYSTDYSAAELTEMKKEFKKYCTACGVGFYSDGAKYTVSEIFENWDID